MHAIDVENIRVLLIKVFCLVFKIINADMQTGKIKRLRKFAKIAVIELCDITPMNRGTSISTKYITKRLSTSPDKTARRKKHK
jgi:hypothetical protein